MKKKPLVENGIIVGTASNKYELKNPIARYLLANFKKAIADLLINIDPKSIIEIGCGEGYVTQILLEKTNAHILATDISETILKQTQNTIQSPRIEFRATNIKDFIKREQAELIVCCEVLEHLENPEEGINIIKALTTEYALISVPREPLWRILNFSRGAYLTDWGNSPGHIQHWSQKEFIHLLEKYFEVLVIKSPIPWTIVLVKKISR